LYRRGSDRRLAKRASFLETPPAATRDEPVV